LLLLSLDRDREYEGRVGEWESDLEKGGGMLALRQQIVSTAQLVRTAKRTYSPLFCVRQLLFVHVYGFCVGFLYCCHGSPGSPAIYLLTSERYWVGGTGPDMEAKRGESTPLFNVPYAGRLVR